MKESRQNPDTRILNALSRPENEGLLLFFVNTVLEDSRDRTFDTVRSVGPTALSQSWLSRSPVLHAQAVDITGLTVAVEIHAGNTESCCEEELSRAAGAMSRTLTAEKQVVSLPVIRIFLCNFHTEPVFSENHAVFEFSDRRYADWVLEAGLQLHFLELALTGGSEGESSALKKLLLWLLWVPEDGGHRLPPELALDPHYLQLEYRYGEELRREKPVPKKLRRQWYGLGPRGDLEAFQCVE